MAKYLSRLGWAIQVVTPHPSLWRTSENREVFEAKAAHERIRLIYTDHQWRCLNPDFLNCWNKGLGWVLGGMCRTVARNLSIEPEIGGLTAAEKACSNLASHDIDLLLATGQPFTSFRLAGRLADKLKCPYILDYRDPWAGNPHDDGPERQTIVLEEAKLLEGCSAVTVVSPAWAEALSRRFQVGSKVNVVTNGYDPEELASVLPVDFGHHVIVYAGNFYPPKRVISPVLAALKRLRGEEESSGQAISWRFHYYGTQGDHVQEEAVRFGVADRVVLHGVVPRAEVLSAVRGADIAVVITTVANQISPEDRGIVPGKLFEILGLGTRVLLVSPPGSDVQTIALPTGLAHSFQGDDIEGMAAFLRHGFDKPVQVNNHLETISWPHLACRMDQIMRSVLGRRTDLLPQAR
jgi:glycosyltransferase involved in cell wall biosynthesis